MATTLREAAAKIVSARSMAAALSPGDKAQPHLAAKVEEGLKELALALASDRGVVSLTREELRYVLLWNYVNSGERGEPDYGTPEKALEERLWDIAQGLGIEI
jgi:hypothetical protein